ncbi:MAG: glycosyltransferase family 4 protein [Eggerthellaceae bacterium]
MPKALCINSFTPSDDAMTRRSLAVVTLLEKCGFDVEVACTGVIPKEKGVPGDFFGRTLYWSRDLSLGKWNLVSKYFERLFSNKSWDLCKGVLDRSCPDIVVVYGVSFEIAKRLAAYCKKRSIAVYADDTDWFDLSFSGDLASYIIGLSKEKRFLKMDPLFDGVIAISKYLEEHFSNLGTRAFFLPSVVAEMPSFDVVENKEHSATELRLIYAGSLGCGKDHLESVLSYIVSQPKSLSRCVSIDIAGVTKDECRSNGWGAYLNDERIRIHGIIEHSCVLSMLRSADFGVLFREDARYAKAGFSTKFSECMSMGVPMICNRVGGADAVISNGYDGVVLDDSSEQAIASALLELASMPLHAISETSLNARSTAESLFLIDSYVDDFSRYINEGWRR